MTTQPAPITHDATLNDDENYILRCGPGMTLGSGYWSDLARGVIAKGFTVRATLDGMPTPDLSLSGVIERPDYGPGYTMREAIDAGRYYHVRIPHWNSGGHDVAADSPEEAALIVGAAHKAGGFVRGVELFAEVCRHLNGSRIGATVMQVCGVFPTLTPHHFDI